MATLDETKGSYQPFLNWPPRRDASSRVLMMISGPLLVLAIGLVLFGLYRLPMPSYISSRYALPQTAAPSTSDAADAVAPAPAVPEDLAYRRAARDRFTRLDSTYERLHQRYLATQGPADEALALRSIEQARQLAASRLSQLDQAEGRELASARAAVDQALQQFERQEGIASRLYSAH